MHVEHRVTQFANGGAGVHPLPEHMAGVEVAPDGGARRLAQAQHRFGVIDHEAGVHFNGHAHAVVFRKFGVFCPIGDDFLLPLPFDDLQKVGRPGSG